MNTLLARLKGKRKNAPAALSPAEQLRQRMPDISDDELETVLRVQPHTMTSPERLVGLTRAVQHIQCHRIGGSIVECGVWRGGSMMAIALTLMREREKPVESEWRDLWLFDTFEGMTQPETVDVDFCGVAATELLEKSDDPTAADSVWCRSHLETVQENMQRTGYPREKTRFVVGPVEETLESAGTGPIALLRLDTDWYESTRCELEQLFPRLVSGGVLIVDDYGHWQGCRRATDEYFARHDVRILLNRMDYTGRMGVKP